VITTPEQRVGEVRRRLAVEESAYDAARNSARLAAMAGDRDGAARYDRQANEHGDRIGVLDDELYEARRDAKAARQRRVGAA
jgi:hypothetical protein